MRETTHEIIDHHVIWTLINSQMWFTYIFLARGMCSWLLPQSTLTFKRCINFFNFLGYWQAFLERNGTDLLLALYRKTHAVRHCSKEIRKWHLCDFKRIEVNAHDCFVDIKGWLNCHCISKLEQLKRSRFEHIKLTLMCQSMLIIVYSSLKDKTWSNQSNKPFQGSASPSTGLLSTCLTKR